MISSEPRLYIVIRKTADWNDETAVRAQLPPVLVPRVDLWNETLAMPYHRFRAPRSAIDAPARSVIVARLGLRDDLGGIADLKPGTATVGRCG